MGSGAHREALGHLKTAYGTDPSHAVAHRVSELAAQVDRDAAGLLLMRVAFLSDHLLGPLPRLVRANLIMSDVLVEPYVAEFDSWQQELADPASKLFAEARDFVILDLTLSRISPGLAGAFLSLTRTEVEREIDRAAGAISDALAAIGTQPNTRAIVHSFSAPAYPALGIYDRLAPLGQRRAVEMLNQRVREDAARIGNTFVLETDALVADTEGVYFDKRMFALAKLPYTPAGIARLAVEYAKYLRAGSGRAKKVLVVDADNTLWGGIVGEDGLDGIRLDADSEAAGYLELQSYVAELGRRGVVLALNSANEHADVDEVFARRAEMILHPEDFAIRVVNWEDKATNLLYIAQTLDLGIDSFVFVDDDPVQCARIRAALPDVAVVELGSDPLGFVPALARPGWFDTLSVTEEDRRRNEMYRADAARRDLESLASDPDQFVGSLQVRLTATRLVSGGLARAASLTQRTNQFNLTTKRYTEDELRRLAADPTWSAFTVRVADRFGDIGVVGLVMTQRDGDVAKIDTFLLSCRALRRRVEDAMLAIAVRDARARGARRVVGVYSPTRKNAQTARFYPERGFATVSDDGPRQRWAIEDDVPFPQAVSIEYEGEGW